MPAPNSISALSTGLAMRLKKPADDVYILDLAHLLHDSSPHLLDLLHHADAKVVIAWEDGLLVLRAETPRFKGRVRRLLY